MPSFQLSLSFLPCYHAQAHRVSTFDNLKAYFDQKFSHLKHKLCNDQVKSSSLLAKKLKTEMNLTFKFSRNKKQFEFNMETLEHISHSLSFV